MQKASPSDSDYMPPELMTQVYRKITMCVEVDGEVHCPACGKMASCREGLFFCVSCKVFDFDD